MHQGTRAEPVLTAWGITTAGKPVLVGLDAAGNEGNDAWDDLLVGLKARGLRPPLLVISDGAAGLVGAIDRNPARPLRQRCLIHRARNILAKVPLHAQAVVKQTYWAIFDMPDNVKPGPRAQALAQHRIDAFAATHAKAYPAAVRCLLDDRQALTAYLRFPAEHWHRIRHSDFIERTFGETAAGSRSSAGLACTAQPGAVHRRPALAQLHRPHPVSSLADHARMSVHAFCRRFRSSSRSPHG